MKKTLAILLALAMVFSTLTVAFAEDTLSADAKTCVALGMLKGDTSAGVTSAYVAQNPTRLTAAILFLRLKGLEDEALAYTGTDNFADADQVAWAGGKAIMGYLKTHPELGWVGDQGKFAPNDKITAQAYYKVMLETLGYKQNTTEVIGDFTYAGVIEFAAKQGLTKVASVTDFTINDVAIATVEALKTAVKGSTSTLVASLVDAKVISEAAATEAGLYTAPVLAGVVESVTVLNAKQLVVTYTAPVDTDYSEDVTNYAIKKAGASAVAMTDSTGVNDATAETNADGRSVTITLANALNSASWGNIAQNDTFLVQISGVKDMLGNVIADTNKSVVFADKVAPTFVKAESTAKTTTNKITLTFNEPVDYSLATVTINGTAAALSAGSTPDKVVVTRGSVMNVGTAYNLSILNIKDAAGNILTPNPVATSVTVSADVVAPTITDFTVVRDNRLKVTFDKSMDSLTMLSNVNVKYLDPNLNSAGSLTSVTAVSNTSNKSWYINLPVPAFNTAGTFTGIISFTDGIKDTAGNAIVPTTRTFTVTKDTVAPAVASTSYQAVTTYNTLTTANGAIIVKFNKSVALGTAVAANYTVINDLGTVLATPASIAMNPNDSTELVIALGGSVASGVKTYTVILPGNAVKDLSSQANINVAANLLVDVSSGAAVASDTARPTVSSVGQTAATSTTSGTVITVVFNDNSSIDAATVISTNNYRLNGAPLPAGSYITLASVAPNYTATINIPAGTITSDDTYAFNITDVKDRAGNAILPFIGSVTLNSDVRPTMNKAVLNSNGTISLGFDNDVVTGVGKEAQFIVKINGSTTALASTHYSIVDGTGSELGNYIVTVNRAEIGMTSDTNKQISTPFGTYTTANAGDVMKFTFIDVDATGTLTAADLLISAVDQGNTTAIPFAVTTTAYNMNNAGSITIATVPGTSTVTSAGNIALPLTSNTVITVK